MGGNILEDNIRTLVSHPSLRWEALIHHVSSAVKFCLSIDKQSWLQALEPRATVNLSPLKLFSPGILSHKLEKWLAQLNTPAWCSREFITKKWTWESWVQWEWFYRREQESNLGTVAESTGNLLHKDPSLKTNQEWSEKHRLRKIYAQQSNPGLQE